MKNVKCKVGRGECNVKGVKCRTAEKPPGAARSPNHEIARSPNAAEIEDGELRILKVSNQKGTRTLRGLFLNSKFPILNSLFACRF